MTDRLDLPGLLASWELHLRAERKSGMTVKSYGDGVRQFLAWCQRTGRDPVLERPTVNAWVAQLLDAGTEAATARARQLAVRRFSAWLAEEGETVRDELLGLHPPKLDQKLTPRLTDDQCRALIKACAGREFRERRDEAILRFMLEAIVRAGEVVAMTTADLDLTRAIDRYLRLRRGHRLADSPALWLGDRGKRLGYDGLYCALRYRAQLAGIPDFHPHLTRHTAAQRWLSAEGSECGLMAVAGWSRRDMIDRYTRATAADRAADEARRLTPWVTCDRPCGCPPAALG